MLFTPSVADTVSSLHCDGLLMDEGGQGELVVLLDLHLGLCVRIITRLLKEIPFGAFKIVYRFVCSSFITRLSFREGAWIFLIKFNYEMKQNINKTL